MQGAIKSSSFLWFTKSKQVEQMGYLGGQLLYGLTVDEPNNLFGVQLRAYKTDKIDYDPTETQTLLKDASKLTPLLAIPQIATGALEAVNGLAAQILTTSNSQDYTLGEGMQFIKAGQTNPQPNHVKFRLDGYDNGQLAVVIYIEVSANTLPSRLGIYDAAKNNDGSRKGFAKYVSEGHSFLDAANFQVGNQQIKLWDILETSGPKQITTGIRLLENGAYDEKQNEGASISTFCRKVYEAISDVYANRDATALYWDVLHRLHEGLAKSQGSMNCLTDREAQMKAHGLPTEDLHSLLHQ
ncbi:MAG TPA: hypothetical protein VKR55_10020 [Bradyrhizobium sp.]|uniref:hypothetical protein n=1 Tax=Bradyrhizobium sp. TaxID=376 RepID=UPI002CBE3D5E|nr:hypothetical protein [Bradyrhizobium sp.]HLZ02472.1 hypothetical protein [Bradyrhizobium sp.]